MHIFPWQRNYRTNCICNCVSFRVLRTDLNHETFHTGNHVNYKHRSTKMTSDKQTRSSSWLLRSCKRSRFKTEFLLYFMFGCLLTHCSARNNPPRFLIDGQTEIVLRLKEGPETPIGKNIIVTFNTTSSHSYITRVYFDCLWSLKVIVHYTKIFASFTVWKFIFNFDTHRGRARARLRASLRVSVAALARITKFITTLMCQLSSTVTRTVYFAPNANENLRLM